MRTGTRLPEALAIILSLASITNATTYALVDAAGGGTVTTDGNLGELTSQDFLAWEIPGFGGSDIAEEFLTAELHATANTLELLPGDSLAMWNQPRRSAPPTDYTGIGYYGGQVTYSISWFEPPSFSGSSSQVIASPNGEAFVLATAVVPEPAGVVLTGLGLLTAYLALGRHVRPAMHRE